jgi:hypothetical protein
MDRPDIILPGGIDLATCFATESNPLTRKMCAALGVAPPPYSARLVGRLVARQ